MIEIIASSEFIIAVENDYSLWASRIDGALRAGTCEEVEQYSQEHLLHPLGWAECYIGKIQVFPESKPRLLFVTAKSGVCDFPGTEITINRIEKITCVPLDVGENLYHTLELVERGSLKKHDQRPGTESVFHKGLQGAKDTMAFAAASLASVPRSKQLSDSDVKQIDKVERRVLGELEKLFNSSNSFYYSSEIDVTRNSQSYYQAYEKSMQQNETGRRLDYNKCDERFFWNLGLHKELISQNSQHSSYWIIPVIQGYIQSIGMYLPDVDNIGFAPPKGIPAPTFFYDVTLISRRSRHRAGTRYRRRGIDDNGNVANYVETEQILSASHFLCSFVITRGSVPVFWKQYGFRYRPPPVLERDSLENAAAFRSHFEQELSRFKHICAISLVEQNGREKPLSDAYLARVLDYNSENLDYCSFDFHEHCRGMKFENISRLLEGVDSLTKEMKYFWSCDNGKNVLCQQTSVFRVNCVDCLDRTNVVHGAFGRGILELQLRRLNALSFEHGLNKECILQLQNLWANNGDTISKQYAGTAALKSDFTRTGERNLFGLMKDGYKSASRYYQNVFGDLYRQSAIEVSLGKYAVETDLEDLEKEGGNVEDVNELQRIKAVLDDFRRQMVTEQEACLGSWLLVDQIASERDGTFDIDRFLILTTEAYIIVEYEEAHDSAGNFQRIPLQSIERIEYGRESSFFNLKQTPYALRIVYENENASLYHTFRFPSIRFFNNMVIPIKNDDEYEEVQNSIVESFKMARQRLDKPLKVMQCKISKRKPYPAQEETTQFQSSIGRVMNLPEAVLARGFSFTRNVNTPDGLPKIEEKIPIEIKTDNSSVNDEEFFGTHMMRQAQAKSTVAVRPSELLGKRSLPGFNSSSSSEKSFTKAITSLRPVTSDMKSSQSEYNISNSAASSTTEQRPVVSAQNSPQRVRSSLQNRIDGSKSTILKI